MCVCDWVIFNFNMSSACTNRAWVNVIDIVSLINSTNLIKLINLLAEVD